jgi:hypothetical protein
MPVEAVEALIGEAVAVTRHQDTSEPDEPMRHDEFQIGGKFWCDGQQWRCTDIGKRVITAIKLNNEDDPSWYNGPPYAVAECVFDEYDIGRCALEPAPDEVDLPLSAPGDATEDDSADAWDSPESNAKRMAQAKALRAQARDGGLRFDAYLPSRLADWLLAHIERGTFRDPGRQRREVSREAAQPGMDQQQQWPRQSPGQALCRHGPAQHVDDQGEAVGQGGRNGAGHE